MGSEMCIRDRAYTIDSSTPGLSTALAVEAKFRISSVMLFSDFKLYNKVVKDIRDLASTAKAVDSPGVEESMVKVKTVMP